jgi:hypothetical protein
MRNKDPRPRGFFEENTGKSASDDLPGKKLSGALIVAGSLQQVLRQRKGQSMRTIIIGNIGSDAGYWVLDDTGLHHVGGWAPEALFEFRSAVSIVGQATRLKTPGLSEAAVKSVQSFIQGELARHLKQDAGGSVVVIMP